MAKNEFMETNLSENDDWLKDEPYFQEDDYEEDTYEDEDDLDAEPELNDYEIKFCAKGLTADEIGSISKYLFEAIEKELGIDYSKLCEMEIEED